MIARKDVLRPAMLQIDPSDQAWFGWIENSKWNGFARPFFDHDTAVNLLTDLGFDYWYDPGLDAFVVPVDFPDEEDVVWPGVAFECADPLPGYVMTVYPIGAGEWAWLDIPVSEWC